jgi:hypothetical protein
VAPIKVYSGEEAALFSTRDAFRIGSRNKRPAGRTTCLYSQ